MRVSIIFFLLLGLNTLYAQQLNEVKFREDTFENGMTYPQVIIATNKGIEDAINANILQELADLQASDFCIGQYGFVQKSTNIQIHVFCNCIDFKESENRYFFYNLENGTNVPYSDMINPKKKVELGEFLAEKVRMHLTTVEDEKSDEIMGSIKNQNFDAFRVIIKRDGVDFWMNDVPEWGRDAMYITWAELKSYLKYHYI